MRLNRIIVFMGVVFCWAAFAEDAVSTESWLLEILTFATKAGGLSTIALAAALVQIAMVFFKTPLSAFAGKWKLMAVTALTVPALILAAMATGVGFMGALGQAPVLAAFQALVFQIYRQFLEPHGPQPL